MDIAPCVAGLLCFRMDLSWITGYRFTRVVRMLKKIARFYAMDLMDATIKKQEWMADTNPGDIERNGGVVKILRSRSTGNQLYSHAQKISPLTNFVKFVC